MMKRILKTVLAGHQWRRAIGWMLYLLIAIAVCLPAVLVPTMKAESNLTPVGKRIGAYLNGTWYMDMDGFAWWDGPSIDRLRSFGNASMTPVTGDWDHNFITEIGAYLNGTWYLDYNGNGVWNGVAGGDKLYYFGNSSMTPVTGVWALPSEGMNPTLIGAYLNGTWYLDYNNNGRWDGVAGGDKLYHFGNSSMKPVTGDWDNDAATEVGTFINGTWYLDYNGNGVWDGVAGGDKLYHFGNASMTPVSGNWNGSGGTEEIGAYLNGTWYLDYNGNGVWDGDSVDVQRNFGNASMKPVTAGQHQW